MAPRSLPEGAAQLLAIQARVASANARIAGMTAQNQVWIARGMEPGFPIEPFLGIADELDALAREADELAPTLHDLQEK